MPDTPKTQRDGRGPAPQQDRTPDADMQPEDAGTPESQPAASGTPAQAVMKQQSKTDHEAGGGR